MIQEFREKLKSKQEELRVKFEQDQKHYQEMYADAISKKVADNQKMEEEAKQAEISYKTDTARMKAAMVKIHNGDQITDKKVDVEVKSDLSEKTTPGTTVSAPIGINDASIAAINAIPGLAVTGEQLQAIIQALTSTMMRPDPPKLPAQEVEEVPNGPQEDDQDDEDSEMKEALEVDQANGNDHAAKALLKARGKPPKAGAKSGPGGVKQSALKSSSKK